MSQPYEFSLLLVDDEADFLENISAAFEQHYRIRMAANGQDALTILAEEKDEPFVILSDQRMPGMTGLELFSEIKSKKIDHLGRFLLTGYGEMALAIDAFNAGLIQNYVEKPITREKIELLFKYIDAVVGDAFYRKWLEGKVAGFPKTQRSVTTGHLMNSVIDFFRDPIQDMLQRHQLVLDQVKESLTAVSSGDTVSTLELKPSLERMKTLLGSNQTTFAYFQSFFDSVGSFDMMTANFSEKYPVNQILLAAIASVKTLLLKKDVIVRTKLAKEQAFIQCIPSDLYVAFVNLLMRATDVSADADWIQAESKLDAGKMVIVIEENVRKGNVEDPALFFDGSRSSERFDLSLVPSIVGKYEGTVRTEQNGALGYRVILEFPIMS